MLEAVEGTFDSEAAHQPPLAFGELRLLRHV
jgi:hypothetical protein